METLFHIAKTYTAACLLYDLIPLINVSFDKNVNAIKNRLASNTNKKGRPRKRMALLI